MPELPGLTAGGTLGSIAPRPVPSFIDGADPIYCHVAAVPPVRGGPSGCDHGGERQVGVVVSENRSGHRLYDRWSRHPGALDVMYAVVFLGRHRAMRRRSVDALDLAAGDSVLELGCGLGNSFPALRERVGAAGRVVGVDYSQGMVERAAERVRANGWENVHVVRADATRPCAVASAFDGVYAGMSLTAMPDAGRVVRQAHRALRPGGTLAVLDARPFQRFPATVLNPVVVPLAERLTNWYPDSDVPAAMRRTFGNVAVTDANGGSTFVAHARKDGAEAAQSHG